jgi:hypothetical protein
MNCTPAFLIGLGSGFILLELLILLISSFRKQKEKKSIDQKVTYLIDLVEKNEKLRKERGY